MYLKYFFGAFLLLSSVFVPLSIYFQPLDGDLTRLGYLSERSFGWNGKRLVQRVRKNPPDEAPDIIVVGDSFSAGNIWQSRLTELTGFTLLTFEWNSFLENPQCFLKIIKSKYPHAEVLILQKVERHSIERMNSLLGEHDQSYDSKNLTSPKIVLVEEGMTNHSRKLIGLTTDINYLVRALLNETRGYNITYLSEKVYISPLSRSDLFTSSRSDRLLYFMQDVKNKESWDNLDVAKSFSSFEVFATRVDPPLVPVLLVIPDKLTVYSRYLVKQVAEAVPAPIFWRELDSRGAS